MHAIRRSATAFGALAAVSLLTVGTSAQAAAPANAPGEGIGTASASTARLGLDVRLLNRTVDIPIDLSLNAIQAPGDKDGSLLTATVAGVGNGPLSLVSAKVGHSSATADRSGSQASVDLVNAQVNVPGLLGSLLKIDTINAQADCPANGRPSASVNVLGDVNVLGEDVSLSASGPSLVNVPGVGKVSLWLSRKTITSHSAAATALELQVSINPLKLNVAEVTGQVELAAVSCQEGTGGGGNGGGGNGGGGTGGGGGNGGGGTGGSGGGSPTSGPSSTPSSTPSGTATASAPAGGTGGSATPVSVQPAAATADPGSGTSSLAETGGGSDAPMIAGLALVLVGAGAGGVVLARRRRS